MNRQAFNLPRYILALLLLLLLRGRCGFDVQLLVHHYLSFVIDGSEDQAEAAVAIRGQNNIQQAEMRLRIQIQVLVFSIDSRINPLDVRQVYVWLLVF